MTLLEIKQKLSAYQVVHCGLSHEAVLLDRKTRIPVKLGNSHEEVYKRVQLCNLTDRNQRLGCAHSSANKAFTNIIEELPTDPIIEKLKREFNKLIFQIYTLDHKKGNLERDFAETLESSNSNGLTSSDVQKELNACIQIHNSYMNQLHQLKSNIIIHIDKFIEN